MSGNGIDSFLNDIVHPTVEEFLRESSSVRRAMLACLTVSSLPDHIHHWCPELRAGRAIRQFREHLARHSRSFALVRDVADATKHVRLTRPSASVDDIAHIREGETLLTTADGKFLTTEEGVRLAAWVGVAVLLPDGTEERLDGLVVGALSFLTTFIGRFD